MKKLSRVFLAIALTTLITPGAFAAGSGDLFITVQPPTGFTDDIVVEYSSNELPGYTGSISNIITLQHGTMYMSQVPGLPSGDYTVYAYMAKPGNKEEIKHPDYTLDYPATISIAENQVYQLQVKVVPWSSIDVVTSAPDGVTPEPTEPPAAETGVPIEPTATPDPSEGTVGGLVLTVMKRSWFTIFLAIVALAVWGGLALRKTIYKD